MQATNAQAAAIRKHLGHGEGNRRVRVGRDGSVTYYGSTDPFCRDHDFWHFGGNVASLLREIEQEQELA